MGRNNIDDRSKDTNWGFNQTKSSKFKFELMDDTFTRRFEVQQGLMMFKLTKSIRLNAYYKIDMNDILDIKEHKPLKVTTIATFYDHNNQGMFKGSTDRYTGYTIVGLE
jgi:hypothetical protein